MASMTASLVLSLLLSACGSGGGTGASPLPPTNEAPGAGAPLPLPSLPLDVPISDLVVNPGPQSGSVILSFTAPGKSGDDAADTYRVYQSVRHFNDGSLHRAAVAPATTQPGPPGTRETITVTGLVPDRTLQFGVRPVRGATVSPIGLTAAGRVTGRDVPAAAGSAIHVDGPTTLSQNGATYLLTRSFSTAGTAFTITGRDVTLDLGGHTVTYGTGSGRAYGVRASNPAGPGRTVVRNGTIRQGAGGGTQSHGVLLEAVTDVRCSYLQITVSGTDASALWVAETDGHVRIDHCTVACDTKTVSNRHYPGVSAVFVEQSTGTVEIDENLVTGSPQWGIRVEGRESTGPSLVHHNRVEGTKALVANGYMLAVHKPDLDVYENLLSGESRGIHADAIDTAGRNAWIHDNYLEVQDQPNAEYPEHWCHGIKLEGVGDCTVERNHVVGRADPTHSTVHALDLTQSEGRGLAIVRNRFTALSSASNLEARAVNLTYGADGSAANDLLIAQNVFVATDTLVYHDWDGGRGGLFRDNWWLRDASQGAGHAFRFEYFGNGTGIPTPEHRFLDATADGNILLDVEEWASPGTYDSAREWTLTLLVRDGTEPVRGATVTVRSRSGATVFTASTDDAGLASGIVLGTRATRGPTFTTSNPHTITVAKSGFETWSGPQTVDRTTAVVVDLGAKRASVDAEAPAAPGPVGMHPLSASRAFVWWGVPQDDTGVVRYRVYLDGQPAGLTREAGLFLGGLAPATRYTVVVEAVDAGGNVSPPSSGVSFLTRPEDRGP